MEPDIPWGAVQVSAEESCTILCQHTKHGQVHGQIRLTGQRIMHIDLISLFQQATLAKCQYKCELSVDDVNAAEYLFEAVGETCGFTLFSSGEFAFVALSTLMREKNAHFSHIFDMAKSVLASLFKFAISVNAVYSVPLHFSNHGCRKLLPRG